MRRVAHKRKGHPKVRRLALAVLENNNFKNSHNYLDEAKALGQFVQSRVRYVKDPVGIEQLHDPLTLIEQMERGVAVGDCDDMSLLLATMLLSIGHQPYFRTVRYKTKTGPYNHIYVVVYDRNLTGNSNFKNQMRLVLDPIVKDRAIGFEVPHVSGDEYIV